MVQALFYPKEADNMQTLTIGQLARQAHLTAAESVTDAALEKAVRRSGPYRGKVIRRTAAP